MSSAPDQFSCTSLPERQSAVLCALCGPLTEEEVSACGLRMSNESGIVHQRRLYIADGLFKWQSLRDCFNASPGIREAAESIERWREERERHFGYRNRSGDLLISRARYALVSGHEKAFVGFYEAYGRTLQALSEHAGNSFFWEQVLGPGLEGASEVPGVVPKTQLAELIACHFAFSAYPAGSCVCGRDLCSGSPADLLYAVRMGDERALVTLRGNPSLAPLAKAAQDMLNGNWDAAFRGFSLTLPSRLLEFSAASGGSMAALFVYACICAFRVKASLALIKKWLGLARTAADLYLDASFPCTSDLTGMMDTLEWLLRARWSQSGCRLPDEAGSPFVWPLLWGCSCLPVAEADGLLRTAGVERVRDLRDRGLPLMAAYTADLLLCLCPRHSALFAALQDERCALPRVAPLVLPDMMVPASELQLQRVENWVNSCAPERRERLYWDLFLDDDRQRIVGLVLRVADAPELMGRSVSPAQVLSDASAYLLDEADRSAFPLLRAMQGGSERVFRELACLAGHPRVRLCRDGVPDPVALHAALPELHVVRRGERVTIYRQELPPGRVLCRTEHSITVPRMCRGGRRGLELGQLEGAHGSSCLFTLDSPDLPRLEGLLARLSREFAVTGDILPPDIPEQASEPELVVLLKMKRRALCPRLLVRLLPSVSELVPPGAGLRRTLISLPGQDVCAVRDLEQERSMVRVLMGKCSLLRPVECESWPVELQALRSERVQLALLEQLQAAGIPVVWSGEKCLSAYAAHASQLDVRLVKQLPGWLEIGGGLQVAPDRVVALAELLEGTLERERVVLKDGTLLLTDAAFTGLLRRLRAACSSGKQGHLRVCRAALPSLLEGWSQDVPEALVQECPDLSERRLHLPSGLCAVLRDYQQEGYRWMALRAEAGLGMCLADDMGLGKTVQTLALLLRRACAGAAMVVTPLSLLGNWVEEIRRFAPSLQVVPYASWDGACPLPENGVLLASYGQLASSPHRAQAVMWHTLVLDEAQNIRNHSTKRAKAVLGLQARARLALTGTPVENGLADLWSIMDFLNPGMLGSLPAFRVRFRSAEELEELRRLVRPLILRRTRRQVLPQLPELTEVRWNVTLSHDERALYESVRRRALALLGKEGASAVLFAELNRLRRLCCHGKLVVPGFKGRSSKLDALMELVAGLRESGHKALVFSQFTDVLDLVEPLLTRAGIRFLRLDGSTPASRRQRLISQFQGGEAELFLISLKAGGVGLNLTAASYVILLDPWWNPAVEAQAAARSHRIGQESPVMLYRLIAEHTVEERVLALHESKRMLADSVISEGSLPLEELRRLLEG